MKQNYVTINLCIIYLFAAPFSISLYVANTRSSTHTEHEHLQRITFMSKISVYFISVICGLTFYV